jgi:hypothetical protein
MFSNFQVSSGEDDDFAMEVDINNVNRPNDTEEYPYEVLTTEEIVNHMVDCIKDVNSVVEVSGFFSQTRSSCSLSDFRSTKKKKKRIRTDETKISVLK